MILQKYSHMYIVSLDHICLFMLHSFYVIFHNTFSQNLQKRSITSNFFKVQICSTKLHCTTGSVTSSGRSCSFTNQSNKLQGYSSHGKKNARNATLYKKSADVLPFTL